MSAPLSFAEVWNLLERRPPAITPDELVWEREYKRWILETSGWTADDYDREAAHWPTDMDAVMVECDCGHVQMVDRHDRDATCNGCRGRLS